MIKFIDVCKAYGGQVLFDDMSFAVNRGEKIGLVGRNGHGKSTVFQLILGELEPDSGTIAIPRNYRIGHLQQYMNYQTYCTGRGLPRTAPGRRV
jgi:ATP-binding cassette subfamily F protein 3